MKRFKVDIGQKAMIFRDYIVEAESFDDLAKLSPEKIMELSEEQGQEYPVSSDAEYYDEYEFGYGDLKESIKEVK